MRTSWIRILITCGVASAALLGVFPTGGILIAAERPVSGMVAVVPFADEVGINTDLATWGFSTWAASRLTELLSRKGVQVVPFADVEAALRQEGLRASDMFSLAVIERLAHRLGASQIITGRLVYADTNRDIAPESMVTFDLSLMEVATKRLSYTEASGFWLGGPSGMMRAAEVALEDFVSHWSFPTI